jgi:hypothetical protein
MLVVYASTSLHAHISTLLVTHSRIYLSNQQSQMRCLQVLGGLLLSCAVSAKLPLCKLKFEILSVKDVRRLISGLAGCQGGTCEVSWAASVVLEETINIDAGTAVTITVSQLIHYHVCNSGRNTSEI